MLDFQAWILERLGWLPHRARRWVEVYRPGHVVINNGDGRRVLLADEAEWLAAELLLAARDARRAKPWSP